MLTDSSLFRRIELQMLMNLTARAIGRPSRRIWILSNERALQVYAEFTRDQLRPGVNDEVLRRMNEEAFKMGRRLRRLFMLRQPADIERFIVALYRNIGIDIEGHVPGSLCFRRCFFSQFYTPAICRVASALDDGIICGLAGGGRLVFSQRITEGHPHCVASVGNHSEEQV